MTAEQIKMWNALAEVFLWCFVFSMALIVLWLVAFLAVGDIITTTHGMWFGLTRRELSALIYGGIAYAKINTLLFFLFPYAAIKLVIRKSR